MKQWNPFHKLKSVSFTNYLVFSSLIACYLVRLDKQFHRALSKYSSGKENSEYPLREIGLHIYAQHMTNTHIPAPLIKIFLTLVRYQIVYITLH